MKKRKILFDRSSEMIRPLKAKVEEANHRALILWVIDCAYEILPYFESDYPDDHRPKEALEATISWSKGDIKMPVARRFALLSHQAANEVKENPKAEAAARALGHVLGTVHVETHALGMVFYGLTSVYHAYPEHQRDMEVRKLLDWMTERLTYWVSEEKKLKRQWASFLLKDDMINKEKQLRIKYESRKGLDR